jgi:predicted transcriptional regulator
MMMVDMHSGRPKVTAGRAAARRRAGELEAAVLAALWTAGAPMTAAQLHRSFGGGLAYNTVHTILTRLCGKGSVRRVGRPGRTAYAPATDAVQWAAAQMRTALEGGTDRNAILQRFVTSLDPADERALRAVLGRESAR